MEYVIGKNKPDSILAVSFTLNFVFYCFCYKLITKGVLLMTESVHNGPFPGTLPPCLSIKLKYWLARKFIRGFP